MRNYILYLLAAVGCLTSCNKQLDLYPKDALSEPTFFKDSSDLELYCNQFYQYLPFQEIEQEQNSDNQVPINPDPFLSGLYVVPATAGGTGWNWANIRACNYFLQRYQRAQVPVSTANKYVAEVRFFRALFYWQMVKQFGDVPWLSTDLTDTSTTILYEPRTPHKQVMDSVLADMQFAVDNLPDLNSVEPNRLHKWAAYALMSRVCLWEGTWRRYHSLGDELPYLQQTVTASEAIINSGNYSLFTTGHPASDYYNLFIQTNLTGNPEAIFFKLYLPNVLTEFYSRDLTSGGSSGFSKNFVRSFLCSDGLPTALSPLYQGDDSLDEEAANRDPRFKQLIATRGFVLQNHTDGTKYIFSIPQIGTDAAPTGYMPVKGLSPDPAQWNANQGTIAAFIFRYAEILLNEAEARAELGTCDQTVIDNTINKLRDRVGMVHMVIASLQKDPNSDFPGLPVLLDEIRRERRIELCGDGFRLDDIMRWKAGPLIQNPETILGMKLIPAVAADYPPSQISGVQLNANGYIKVYSFDSRSWSDKMYLYPIPTQELTLNPNYQQNPGW